uniref:protein-arginine deiminase n=1 Tax=Leptobrachium leishanense TaxID=445787 RepID=A0A8C5MRU8_9ANUR
LSQASALWIFLKPPVLSQASGLGTETLLKDNSVYFRSVPVGADSFDVRGTSLLDVTIIYDPNTVKNPQAYTKWPLNKGVKVVISSSRSSRDVNDSKVSAAQAIRSKSCMGGGVRTDLQTGRRWVNQTPKNCIGIWTWGPNGKGAILVVNCDRDKDSAGTWCDLIDVLFSSSDIKDMSPMTLITDAPEEFFDEHRVILRIQPTYADKIRVYCRYRWTYKQVLGGEKLSYKVERNHQDEISFYVEGLQFPDADFDGLVYIKLSLENSKDNVKLFSEKLAFRIAPWIMTPNTLKPLEVYVCSLPDNQDFLKQIKALVNIAYCNLHICKEVTNRGDRWIQDEMEFGYTEAPHKRFPVVFDSPRNRGLKDFPFKQILGPDFGYVTKEPDNQHEINTLDSFGNLEVSPPVSVKGKEYPLGRILIGSGLTESNVRMNKIVQAFLAAQKVQEPVELYSYWLTVGHIDEFMSFVPAPDRKGFRLLLASPRECIELFKEKQKQGCGKASVQIHRSSINEILSDEKLNQYFDFAQECVDMNRKILKKELGLTEDDIIDVPMLYHKEHPKGGADSYFPNMVNMLVLGKYLGIPKPFGPLVNGRCCLEEKVQNLLEPLGLKCIFIDDFESYHLLLGEVHCGTNTLRKPFTKKWWECQNPAERTRS